MKIIAISGSYRKGKTIDILIDKAIEGIKHVDPLIEVEKIRLAEQYIKYCTNCMTCKNDNPDKPIARCIINDAMSSIYEKMLQADGYILATPINCGTVTALMKTFIERSIWVFAKPGTRPVKGCPNPRSSNKKAAVFIVSSGLIPPFFRWLCDDATKLLGDLALCGLNARILANLYAGAVEKRGVDCYFRHAQKIGEKLAQGLLKAKQELK